MSNQALAKQAYPELQSYRLEPPFLVGFPNILQGVQAFLSWKFLNERYRILYHSFKKFAASRPKAMKKPLSPVIASAAKQSPGRYGDCFAACGGSQCNGRKFSTATVENFLPQQGWGG
jgi:hypothetical protein